MKTHSECCRNFGVEGEVKTSRKGRTKNLQKYLKRCDIMVKTSGKQQKNKKQKQNPDWSRTLPIVNPAWPTDTGKTGGRGILKNS